VQGRDAVQDAGRDDLITVAEAAERLGITKEAVRKRISRGTLRSDKDQDGTVHVYVPQSAPQSAPQSEPPALVDVLQEQNAYLREQLRREQEAHAEARRIIAGLVQRVPELESSSDTSGSPRTASDAGDRGQPRSDAPGSQEGERRPWWRRVFRG